MSDIECPYCGFDQEVCQDCEEKRKLTGEEWLKINGSMELT